MTIVTRSSCRRTDSGTWVQDNDYARPILSLKLRPGISEGHFVQYCATSSRGSCLVL
jgi:hypothetical protein